MCWGFIWGLVIGVSLGCLLTGLITSAHNKQKYIELNYYEEKNEVEE